MRSQKEVNDWAEKECKRLGDLIATRLDAEDLADFIQETVHAVGPLAELLVCRTWAYFCGLDVRPLDDPVLEQVIKALQSYDSPCWTSALGYVYWCQELEALLSAKTQQEE